MNCETVMQHLDDWLDRDLGVAETGEIRRHLDHCASCHSAFEAAQALALRLKEMPVPAPSADFETRVFAPFAKPRNQRHGFAMGFGSAMAASLAAWLIFTPLGSIHPPVNSQPLQVVSVTIGEVHPLRVAFNAPHDYDNVRVTLELPEHLELAGYAGQRRLQWQTRLRSGQNVLTLPVIAHRAERAVIVARLSNDDTTKIFQLVIEPKPQQRSLAIPDQQVV